MNDQMATFPVRIRVHHHDPKQHPMIQMMAQAQGKDLDEIPELKEKVFLKLQVHAPNDPVNREYGVSDAVEITGDIAELLEMADYDVPTLAPDGSGQYMLAEARTDGLDRLEIIVGDQVFKVTKESAAALWHFATRETLRQMRSA